MDDGASEVRLQRGGTGRSFVALAAIVVVVVAWIVMSTADRRTEDDASSTSEPTTTAVARPGSTTTSAAPPVLALDGTEVEVHDGLDGVSLDTPSNLEIVLGRTLIDVDAGQSQLLGRPSDQPVGDPAGVQTLRIGSDVVIVRFFYCQECEHVDTRVFVLRSRESETVEIFKDFGIGVAPAPQGLWITRRSNDEECVIERIDLYGIRTDPPRRINCDMNLVAETEPLGLIARSQFDPEGVPIRTSYVLDPKDLQELFHTRQLVAASGKWMLVHEGRSTFALEGLDGTRVRLPTPAAVGEPGAGAVTTDGRYIAVPFVGHHEDLWVLDVLQASWMHVPSFPVQGVTRALAIDWSPDGRLVLIRPHLDASAISETATLATWRPGEPRLRIRQLTKTDGRFPNLVVRHP